MRRHVPALLGALLGVAALCWLGLLDFAWSDYDREAAPALRPLAEGRVADFLALAPTYGGSLVLRAPTAETRKVLVMGGLSDVFGVEP